MSELEYLNEVPDESESSKFGLTEEELRNRLKHIAGLCYALSCDIANVELESTYLRQENTYLRSRLQDAGIKVPPPMPKNLRDYKKRMAKLRQQKKAPTKKE